MDNEIKTPSEQPATKSDWRLAVERLEHECLITSESDSSMAKDITLVCTSLAVSQARIEALERLCDDRKKDKLHLYGLLQQTEAREADLTAAIEKHHVKVYSGGPDGPIEFCAANCWACAVLNYERKP